MRLSNEHGRLIKETLEAMLGCDVRITLFGSRLHDEMRGGGGSDDYHSSPG